MSNRGQQRTTKGADSINNNNTKTSHSDHERRKESSRLSQQALAAQKKAQELRQAANGAADPDERQHLMEEAINKQIEAESFGKTAKYLQSGTFQGMAVGTGIGTVPGLTLGTLTGTLVGGSVTLVTGGLGGALGAATGALHGPFWNMGKLAGKGIRKVTGDLPGWKATGEQKATLEKMIGQVNEQEPPSEADLKNMTKWEAGTQNGGHEQTWAEYGASYLPSMSTPQKSKPQETNRVANSGATVKQKDTRAASTQGNEPGKTTSQPNTSTSTKSSTQESDKDLRKVSRPSSTGDKQPRQPDGNKTPTSNSQQQSVTDTQHLSSPPSRKKPRKLDRQQPNASAQHVPSPPSRKTPRKLERQQPVTNSQEASSPRARKIPRKLEVRKQDVR